jgi:hypothetical protein
VNWQDNVIEKAMLNGLFVMFGLANAMGKGRTKSEENESGQFRGTANYQQIQ